MADHYFSRQPESKSEEREIEAVLSGNLSVLKRMPVCFRKEELILAPAF